MKKRNTFIVFFILLIGFCPVSPQSVFAEPRGPHVVNIEFETSDQLAALSARLDVWSVDRETGTLVAYVTSAERVALESAGYRLHTDSILSSHPDTIPDYPCYRTIDEIYTQLNAWETEYYAIAQLSTIGYSYEGRPLKVMRLTQRAIGGEKPIFFLMANIHGRELITNETAMIYIQYLLENYETDPDVTWLLNEHEIYVLVSANPDGHVKNEPGEPWAWWRKNTNPTNGTCSGSGGKYGIDLNRNSSFKWGGASTNPCDETYQGPTAASEVETQAVQFFIESIFEDQRGPGDNDPAPDDTTGVFITLHSYSNLILWPWGHTYTAAPNASQLRRLGEKMASYNGYLPEQASDLYPTTGSTDEWSYGELGIASFTFEIGSSGDGFYPSCSRYDSLIQPNIPALLYAAKVARTPYMTPFGPDALGISVTPNAALAGEMLKVQATLNDDDNGGEPITAAEAYISTPPWDGGTAYPLTASDGAFDETVESVRGQVGTGGLPEGRQLVYVRGQDSAGNWGPVSAAFVDITYDGVVTGLVTEAGTGAPLAGTVVSAVTAKSVYSSTTRSDGSYSFPLRSDTYTMTTALFGYETQTALITITTGVTTTQNFTLTRQPWGTLTVAVNELGTGATLDADVTIGKTPLRLTTPPSATVDLPAGTYVMTATSELGYEPRHNVLSLAPGEHMTHVFRLPPPPPLLVVDDDEGKDYQSIIRPHLDNLMMPYDVWEIQRQGVPPKDLLSVYDGILWLTGNDRLNSLNVSEQAALARYLDEGGRLLLTGQNIGADIRNDPGHFYRDVLMATFIQDKAGSAVGVLGSHPYSGISAELWNGSGADNQDSPDVIAPYNASATQVFTYTTGGAAGLAVEKSPYRLIYLGFGLEGVADASIREEILHRSLTWLEIEHPPARLILDVTDDNETILQGQSDTYTLELFNDSLIDVSDGALTVGLPVSASVIAAMPSATLSSNDARWDEITLASEGKTVFSWTLELDAGYVCEALTQTIAASWVQMAEPATWLEMTPVTLAGAAIGPATAIKGGLPGETVSYTLTVTNTGNVTDSFDLALTGNTWATTPISGAAGPLAPGTSADLTLVVTIPSNAQNGQSDAVSVILRSNVNPGKTSGSTLTTKVSDQSTVLIVGRPEGQDGDVDPGDRITFTIAVNNAGDDPVMIKVSDQIPTHTTYIPNSVTGGMSYKDSPGEVTWYGTLAAREGRIFTFQVAIDDNVPMGHWITNTVIARVGDEAYTDAVMIQVRPFPPLYLPLILNRAEP